MGFFLPFWHCFCSGFGDVERCVEICIRVWIWYFLAHLLLLCQRPEFQVSHRSVFTALSLSRDREITDILAVNHLTFPDKPLN